MKAGDSVKIKNDSFRNGQTGVVVSVNVFNKQLRVFVNLVTVDDQDLWFTNYQLEKTENGETRDERNKKNGVLPEDPCLRGWLPPLPNL